MTAHGKFATLVGLVVAAATMSCETSARQDGSTTAPASSRPAAEPADDPEAELSPGSAIQAALPPVSGGPVQFERSIKLPAIQGYVDHMALDAKRDRMWIVCLNANQVIIVDLQRGVVIRRLKDVDAPTDVAYLPDLDEFVITERGTHVIRRCSAESGDKTGDIKMPDAPDAVRYDADRHLLFSDCGKSVVWLDPAKPDSQTVAALDGPCEGFALDPDGVHIYANVPRAEHVAVIDRSAAAVTARWPLTEAVGNYPMALDGAHHRLFVGCSNPHRLLVFDTQAGKQIAALTISSDCIELMYDAASRRLIAPAGVGALDIFRQKSADEYELEARLGTQHRARTGTYDAATKRLYIAAPAFQTDPAKLMIFSMRNDAPDAAKPPERQDSGDKH